MKSKINKTLALMAAAVLLSCSTASAQRRYHHGYYQHYHHATAPVTVLPVSVSQTSNHLKQNERLQMAVAYLSTHKTLSIKQYAKMTGLAKAMAEAELDAFACDTKKPIACVVNGKQKLYTKRANHSYQG